MDGPLTQDSQDLEVGYDIPAKPGMSEADIQTPCLVIELDALERNIRKMGEYANASDMRLRVHGKMHKSVDIAKLQQEIGGAVGVCCQKVAEAEAFVRGGIKDVLITNQIRDLAKINRLAQLPKYGAKICVCIDDLDNVAELSKAAAQHATQLDCLVEIDCGAGRCGVTSIEDVVAIAEAIARAEGLHFRGVQAYNGALQHHELYDDRAREMAQVIERVRASVQALNNAGLTVAIVSGGGTGSYGFESRSSIYNELQCGSYAFMDADYGRVKDTHGQRLDHAEWENAFFILTQVMSRTKADQAICDAGLKVQSVDSGLPVVYGRSDVSYVRCTDEHGVISDPNGVLNIRDKLKLIPGHCDPTANIHDWYVGVRNGKVEVVWPVTARGKSL